MRNLLALCLLLTLAGCAAAKPQPEGFTNAQKAIDAAVKAGAEQNAPVELRFAREKLAEAQKGMEYKQYDKVDYLLEQSEINSILATEKTGAAILRGQVAELSRQNEILREDFRTPLASHTNERQYCENNFPVMADGCTGSVLQRSEKGPCTATTSGSNERT